MKLYDKGMIDASPEEVWPYVSDPHLMSQWNEKLAAINRRKEGKVDRGEKYQIRYRMSGKETDSEVTVMESTAPNRIGYQHQIHTKGKQYEAIEAYELKPVGEQTEFCQIIDISKAMLWWAKPLVWFLNRFGESQGKTNVERISDLLVSDKERVI